MTTETQPPARIWLQIPERDHDEPFVADGWTWCQDSVNDTDVEYVRADLALPMPVLREEDRAALTDEQIIAIRKRTSPAVHAQWADTLAFARAIIVAANGPAPDRSAQVADVLCCARLYASAFREASAGIWTGPDHMEPSKASYMDLESAVKRLAGVVQ